MHRLSSVHIRNFRSCRDVGLSLGDCTPIVGYNNAGKSNLLTAIEWFVAPSSLRETDFHDSSQPVTVDGIIAGLDGGILNQLEDEHRRRIEPLIGEGELVLRRIQYEPNVSTRQIKLQVPDKIEADGSVSSWRDHPGGIPEALKNLFPEPITVGAMEDAAEDATKAKKTSTIGKLLAQFTGPAEASHGAELTQALAPLTDKLTAAGAERAEELNRFDHEATEALRPFFPGIKLHLDIPVPSVKELFSRGTIRVSEQGRNAVRDFTALGHGAQRSIQMALIRYLADFRADQHTTAQRRLLLIEEPELFLHPQAIEQVRSALDSLSGHGYQVIFASHSPVMVERETAAHTRIVRKSAESGETRVTLTAEEALKKRIQDDNKRLHALFGLENANHWLFSDRVLIAEGSTERYLLPFVYEAVTRRKPADDGLAILGLGGGGSLPESLTVFRELGIEVCALADLDFAANQAVQHGLIPDDDEDLCKCLRQIHAMADDDPTIFIGDNGRPCRNARNPAGSKKPSVVFRDWAARPESRPVAESLHHKLRGHDVWLWTGGDIEHHLGLSGSKDISSWAPFRRRLDSEPFDAVVYDSETVKALVQWVRPACPAL
ncbi:ATP-dependent endonuclease [Thioalkalivibrio sp. ALMg9]|uniref:ATP-dependent nuclease n=1 Tax=Thioalkalivibrio sp. ALMg9 TaxID=1266912 RepID=UPI0003A393D2|nr:ATP-binding protein [Thioalkalivibrio sp. ALMg9]